jgi:hypothetical protein
MEPAADGLPIEDFNIMLGFRVSFEIIANSPPFDPPGRIWE